MPARVNKLEWPAIVTSRSTVMPRLGCTARITAQLLAWPLLVKAGLLSGFVLAAAVQHLVEV